MVKLLVFQPQKQENTSCTTCQHHLKGCCFDPKKAIEGFIAAPCFGCKEFES